MCSMRQARLLYVRAHDAIPFLGDRGLCGLDLFQRREDRLFIGCCRWQLVQQFLRDLASLRHRVEADRVAVALQIAELAFIRIDVFHPQLRSVRMRCVGADRLNIHASDNAGLRNDGFDFRVALERVAVSERIVVPADDDRGRALCQRSSLADDRNEIAVGIQFLVEFKALLACGFARFRTTGNTGGMNAEDSLCRNARVTCKRNGFA